jgi:hypothetical protein
MCTVQACAAGAVQADPVHGVSTAPLPAPVPMSPAPPAASTQTQFTHVKLSQTPLTNPVPDPDMRRALRTVIPVECTDSGE